MSLYQKQFTGFLTFFVAVIRHQDQGNSLNQYYNTVKNQVNSYKKIFNWGLAYIFNGSVHYHHSGNQESMHDTKALVGSFIS